MHFTCFIILANLYLAVHAIEKKTKVVVLGAGAAGVSVGKTLSASGIEDFIIVDAQPFVGGRVQHKKFGNSFVEMGANWIYGKGENPIYKMAIRHGLKTVPNEKENLAFFGDNCIIDKSVGNQVYFEFEDLKLKLLEYAGQRIKRGQVDLSTRSGLSLLGWKKDTPLKAAVEYFNIDWELAEPPEICSLDYAMGNIDSELDSYPSGNEFVVDPRGFNHIIKEELKNFIPNDNDSRIMLNTLVTSVFYNDDNVTIYTAEGDTIIADYAICTFSLGVLQSNLVNFQPVFPEWKREALLSFHMTTYTKIFLKFEKQFWDDWQFALFADNATSPNYVVWQNLNAPGYLFQPSLSEPILMVTVTNQQSERIELMSDRQIMKEITNSILRMFPNGEAPIDILVPRWQQNPLFRGSYSNWPIGAFDKHHMNIRAPLSSGQNSDKPRLWFAGEATSTEYYGYLHGAWIEGKSVAKQVVQCLKSKCPSYNSFEFVTSCDPQDTPNLRFLRQYR